MLVVRFSRSGGFLKSVESIDIKEYSLQWNYIQYPIVTLLQFSQAA